MIKLLYENEYKYVKSEDLGTSTIVYSMIKDKVISSIYAHKFDDFYSLEFVRNVSSTVDAEERLILSCVYDLVRNGTYNFQYNCDTELASMIAKIEREYPYFYIKDKSNNKKILIKNT